MSVIACLSPLLFLTFREMYGLSYSQLGFLVLINFVTQLVVDLIFSFFSHRFEISKIVRITPIITILGLLIYSVPTVLFPQAAYGFILAGTVIFSSASGLSEVLTSPVVAALPSDNPDREMSKLHSIYAWGVVVIVIINTVLLKLLGGRHWQILALLWTAVPLAGAIMFARATLPTLATPERASRAVGIFRDKRMLLCVFSIFLGGAVECTMSQWSSGYIESALGLPKIYGDIFGVAVFGLAMGIGRSGYGKFGKKIYPVLVGSFAGSIICYSVAAVSGNAVVGLIACGLTGFSSAMLWPGSLIMMEDIVPSAGVACYAIMAAGGDLGASVGPQLVGIIADRAGQIPALASLAEQLEMSADMLGMRLGLMVAAVLSAAGAALVLFMWRLFANNKKRSDNFT